MPRHILSPEAAAEMSEIFAYIAADNPDAAEKLINRFHDLFRLIARNPALGKERPELEEKLRSIPEGSYQIFYRSWASNILIVRVLHTARDLDEIFS